MKDKSETVHTVKNRHGEKVSIKRTVYSSPSSVRDNFETDSLLRDKLNSLCDMNRHSTDWMPQGFSAEKAIAACTVGLPDNVEAIKEQRERAERLDVRVMFPSWQADVAGAFPDVPAYLAGAPDCMRRMVNQPTDLRPIRIFVGMASSSAFNTEQLTKRGALISALAMKLACTRSVEIFACNAGHSSEGDWAAMVRLHQPSSASDLSYWLCHQASVRGLLYAIEMRSTGTLSWPHNFDVFGQYALPNCTTLFGAGESDLVFPFSTANNAAEANMLNNPDLWMRQALERVNALVA